MATYDAIIVGAGPAGSAAAIDLARAGHDVLLLERGRFPRDKICGDLVNAKGLALLGQLGCLPAITERARTPIASATVYLNGHEVSQGMIPQLPGLPPHGYAIPRVELDAVLFERARAVGVTTIEDCQVHALTIHPRGVEVDAMVTGRPLRFGGRVVVGADGAQSVVARAVGLAMQDARYVVPALRGYCRGVPFGQAILYLDEEFVPGYGWIFPVAHDLSNLGVGMLKEPLVRHGLALREFYARLTRFVARLAAERGRTPVFDAPRGWPIKTYGGATRNVFARGVLVGDAGCFVDPISGEGIPLALETAKIASEVLDEALRRDVCTVDALAVYERRWRDRYDADLKLADLTVALVRNRHLGALWLEAFRVAGMTAAASDEGFARTMGGIMAGLTPASAGLSPQLLFSVLARAPGFGMAAFPRSLSDVLEQAMGLASWQAGVARAMLADGAWSQAWLVEVRDKWLDVLRTRV